MAVSSSPPNQSSPFSEPNHQRTNPHWKSNLTLIRRRRNSLSLSDLITQVCSAPLCLFLFVSWNLWFLTDWLIINFFFYCSAYLLFADRLVLGVLFFLILKAPFFCCSFMEFFFFNLVHVLRMWRLKMPWWIFFMYNLSRGSLFLPFILHMVRALRLTYSNNSFAGIEVLSSQLKKLENLDLSFNRFNDSVLSHLCGFSSLKYLNLTGNI